MASKEVKPMATEKINGFDKWEVEEGARTLIKTEELKNKPKFYAAVKAELRRQAKAVQEAAQKIGEK